MFKEQLKAKMKEQEALVNKAILENRALTDEEQKKFDVLEDEIKNLEKTIEAQAKIEAREKENKTLITDPLYAAPKDEKPLKLFKNLVDQLKAIKRVATEGVVDERLAKIDKQVKAAALGMNEDVDSDGGFAVQSDFGGMMLESAAKAGNILPLVDRYEITSGSNRVEWNEIDETSVATDVFGGVRMYWAAEAGTVGEKAPKLKEMELKLQKLLGFAYATYELDADSNFISDLYTRSFTLAMQRELEACIINGTGVGKPLGILKSGSLIQVSKESGQAAGTILWNNISKMYNRALDKTNSIWLMHPDCHEQLDFMQFPVGTGGVPVYLEASKVGDVDTLKGRPVIDSDQCSALGSLGDINFVDLSKYLLVTKGGMLADTSMHVQFLTAQNCFRFIFRANGMPKKNTTLTIKNSSNARSSIVSLQAR